MATNVITEVVLGYRMEYTRLRIYRMLQSTAVTCNGAKGNFETSSIKLQCTFNPGSRKKSVKTSWLRSEYFQSDKMCCRTTEDARRTSDDNFLSRLLRPVRDIQRCTVDSSTGVPPRRKCRTRAHFREGCNSTLPTLPFHDRVSAGSNVIIAAPCITGARARFLATDFHHRRETKVSRRLHSEGGTRARVAHALVRPCMYAGLLYKCARESCERRV